LRRSAMGCMERINATPLPFIYVAHLRIFMLVYLFFLPLVLVETWGWLTVVVMAVISWALMGVEAASSECERPFKRRDNHLHLERFCNVVTSNICQLVQAEEEVAGDCRPILLRPHL